MKNLYLLLLVFMTTATLSAQNVTIPDANFKAYLVGNASINTNGDAEIQVSEASAYSGQLNCYSLGISDLTGIEAFVNLTAVFCNNNDLTTLDLSANTALTSVHCSNNNLTSLNLGMNTVLTDLSCGRNNLTSLDLALITALVTLDCSSNSLTVLDVTTNGLLEILYCYYNPITNLDLSQNTVLEKIDISDCNLVTINLNNNINLTNVSVINVPLDSLILNNNTALEVLRVGRNKFATVDVSNNTNLTWFASFIGENLLYLDLSNNPALEILDLRRNKMIWLNLANGNNSILTGLSLDENPNLTCIQVDDVAYSVANWTNLVDPASSFNTNCGACILNIPDANLKAALVANTAININGDTEIQCEEAVNYTGVMNVSSLNISDMTGMDAFVKMTELNCSGNQIDTLELTNMLNLTTLDISNNPALLYLNCGGNNLSTLNVTNNTALINLSAYSNNLSALDVSSNTNLEILNCGGNNLSVLDVSGNTNLEFLNCGQNNLTGINLVSNLALVDLYVHGNALTALDVSQNINLNRINAFDNNLTNLDVSQDTALTILLAYRNNLNNLSLRGLSTTKLTLLNVTDNPNLTCIDVTDVAAATATWTNIDTQSYFSSTPCFNSTTDLPLVQPIKVYPNPTTGNVNIDLGQKYNNATITLHNVMGQMISNKSYENRRNINFEIEAPKGIYFVNIVSDTGKQTTVKVIKE